jgi:hypothetical protein
MGWTCGYLVASAKDVAKFYWKLLGPNNSILSAEALKEQTQWSKLDFGWAKDHLWYAGGLMVENTNHTRGHNETIDDLTAYWGHGGDTYGYISDQGFFPNLNFSLSVISDVDIVGFAP